MGYERLIHHLEIVFVGSRHQRISTIPGMGHESGKNDCESSTPASTVPGKLSKVYFASVYCGKLLTGTGFINNSHV